MNKKVKISTVIFCATVVFLWWAYMYATGTKETNLNYYWAAALAGIAILFGLLGLFTSKRWSWLKSDMGKAIFSISLGVVMWGIAQAGWTYFIFAYPDQEVVQSKLLDLVFFISIPLWTYGILKLSKATGAKYRLKSTKGKLLVTFLPIIMFIFSYYFLIVVARGGLESVNERGYWITFFDYAYAIGDVINLTLAIAIFGLSWNLLGGRFKKPILAVLTGFGLMYIADFAFSYLDGKGLYYNGDISDLMFLIAMTTFGVALCLLDPGRAVAKKVNNEVVTQEVSQPNESQNQIEEPQAVDEQINQEVA
jgi:hypothetical protein